MTEKDTFLLMVYGTLMSDGCRNGTLCGQKFIRPITTKPNYALLDLGSFPGLIWGEREVEGELWEVDVSLIPALDAIENAPYMYRLELVEIRGDESPVYSYFFNRHDRKIPLYEGVRWNNTRR